jgi:hypothetical protein
MNATVSRRQRPRGLSAEQLDLIESYAGKISAPEIRNEMERRHLIDATDHPDVRTVAQAVARQVRQIERAIQDRQPAPEVAESKAYRQDHEPWRLDSDPATSGVVLRVLAGLLTTSGLAEHLPRPTVGQARWIGVLNAAVPDLVEQPGGAVELYLLAGVYLGRAERSEPTDDLDSYLALAPWRDGGAALRAAIRSGRADPWRWYRPELRAGVGTDGLTDAQLARLGDPEHLADAGLAPGVASGP